MKIALLHNINRGEGLHESEFDLPSTIRFINESLSKEHAVFEVEGTQDFVKWLIELTLYSPDLVFNIAEGFRGAAREAVYPAILEQLDIQYAGPGPTELTICHNKSLAKKLLSEKVPVAWSRLISSPSEVFDLDDVDIPYPLIVKLNSEGSSLGMDENCIVYNFEDLKKQVQVVWNNFKTNIIIEEYIEGIDVSMTYVEGMGVFGPVQYTYPTGEIYDFKLKTSENDTVDVVLPNNLTANTKYRLKDLTKLVVNLLDINGYGRADFRIKPDGTIYFLEMNAQVSFHPQGAFLLAPVFEGATREEVILHIANHAKLQIRRASAVGK
jgi:D-alanine-D-alanine ligase